MQNRWLESPEKKEQTNFDRKLKGNYKQVLVIDDNYDSASTAKSCLENYYKQEADAFSLRSGFRTVKVTVYI
ncbi:MAG: hypothetical protein ACRD5B_12535, partial [Nitrososphaeraceae archaeon]